MKQGKYLTANHLWNAGATEVQQLNPGGPDQWQNQAPANLTESFMPEPSLRLRPDTPACNLKGLQRC